MAGESHCASHPVQTDYAVMALASLLSFLSMLQHPIRPAVVVISVSRTLPLVWGGGCPGRCAHIQKFIESMSAHR